MACPPALPAEAKNSLQKPLRARAEIEEEAAKVAKAAMLGLAVEEVTVVAVAVAAVAVAIVAVAVVLQCCHLRHCAK